MKALVLIFELCLMLSMPSTRLNQVIPLTLQSKSVDDVFSGCIEEMNEKVHSTYFPEEMKETLFKEAWDKAESCAKKKYKKRKDKSLTKEQVQALCVYTAESPNIYEPFNAAVKTGADKYGTPNFKYHSLYYWLSTAVRTLHDKNPCRTTYSRTNSIFTGQKYHFMRLGSFINTNVKANLFHYGSKTCFYIDSCLGVDITKYSAGGKEKVVLIPPYERFFIGEIKEGSYLEMSKCEKIIALTSVGKIISTRNCKAAGVSEKTDSHSQA